MWKKECEKKNVKKRIWKILNKEHEKLEKTYYNFKEILKILSFIRKW